MEALEKIGPQDDFLVAHRAPRGVGADPEAPGDRVRREKIPMDDARTYEMLTRGEVSGVFQLESSG